MGRLSEWHYSFSDDHVVMSLWAGRQHPTQKESLLTLFTSDAPCLASIISFASNRLTSPLSSFPPARTPKWTYSSWTRTRVHSTKVSLS